jgi:hypothetical protein
MTFTTIAVGRLDAGVSSLKEESVVLRSADLTKASRAAVQLFLDLSGEQQSKVDGFHLTVKRNLAIVRVYYGGSVAAKTYDVICEFDTGLRMDCQVY